MVTQPPVLDPALIEYLKQFISASALMNFIATILSLACTYLPRFRVWYASKSEGFKALFQVAILAGLVVLVGVVSFTGVLVLVAPDWNGIIALVLILFQAITANQAVYKLSSQPVDVKEAKALRLSSGQTLNLPDVG